MAKSFKTMECYKKNIPYLMPDIVTDVSAIFVDKTNFLMWVGVDWKADIWSSADMAAYNGNIWKFLNLS